MSRAGTPRRRENRAGLPADAGVFLGREAVESVWRRGLDLDRSRTVLGARGSDFRFPDRGPRAALCVWPTVKVRRRSGDAGAAGDPRRSARADRRAGGRGRCGQGQRHGLHAGAAPLPAGQAPHQGVGGGGDHRRDHRARRALGGPGVEKVTVEKVTVESTSDYWRAFLYLLEAAGLEVQLVNARDVKNVPGRPKTDKLDAVWLAKLTERGMLRPSFVPPAELRQLRDYTRLRVDLTRDRARHVQRIEKLLEDALIKLSTVATDIMGKSGRAMLEALISGQRDPKVLAGLARGRMK